MDAEDRAYLQGLRAEVAELAGPWRTAEDGPLTVHGIEPLLRRAAAAALTQAERQRWEHAALLANVVCWGDDLMSETARELWESMLASLRVLTRPRSTPD